MDALNRFTERFKHRYANLLEAQQVRLASNIEGLPLLALLGLICGVLSGGVIILFRLVIESNATGLLPSGNPEGFESINGHVRFALCVAGGLLVGLLLHVLKAKSRNVGVAHVIERLDYHQGNLPIRNAIVQFVTAAIALISGQSVGREGPSVHLGATSGSVLGRLLSIPNNGVRILVGSGVAAAISAAFDTPLAGVIFAMEVVIMEYTVIGFTPVILASVSAAALSRMTFGTAAAGFMIPSVNMQSLTELPLVALTGAAIGVIAAGFIQLTLIISTASNNQPIWLRTTLAGVITGLVAYALPQVMGTGYDTVDELLTLSPSVGMGILVVVALLIAKTFCTASAVGLGVPAGLIGPTLFIGAAAGAAAGLIFDLIAPGQTSIGLYAVLGMAAMMAATLQAPLAALVSLLELTSNHALTLPGMVAVITASLITRTVFGKSSIYRHLMLAKGQDYRNSGLAKALRRVGVASVMDRSILQQQRHIEFDAALEILKQEPRWILLIDEDDRKTSLLPATDLAHYLNELHNKVDPDKLKTENRLIDLIKIPAKRLSTAQVTMIATLQEAHDKMNAEQCDVLYITGAHGSSRERIYGVITREHIESSYRV